MQQLRDIVTDDPHEEGDEDDGQDHPQPDTGVQQELGATHPPLNLSQADKKRTAWMGTSVIGMLLRFHGDEICC